MTTRSWLWCGWVFGVACTGGGDKAPRDSGSDTGTTEADTDTDTDADADTDADTDTDTGTDTGAPTGLPHFTVVADASVLCGYGEDCLGATAFAVAPDGVAFAAWVHDDPSGYGTVEFTSSDGGTTWGPAQVLGPAGDLWQIDQLDLAIDPVTDELVACWSETPPSGPGALHVATSTDRGATWSDGVLTPLRSLQPAYVDCDAHGGTVAVGFSAGPAAALAVRDGSGTWTRADVPNATFDLAYGPVAAAVRPSDGEVFLAFFDEPPAPASYERSVYVWGPSTAGAPTPALASGGRQNDAYEVDLRFDGDVSWMSVQLELEGLSDSIWLLSSDDQATWSDEAAIQEDPGEEFGNAGFAGAMDLSAAAGRVSLGLQVIGGSTGTPACPAPKLIDTTDGTTFDPCNLTNAAEDLAGFGMQIGEDATGRRQALFLAVDPYGPLPPGVLQWLE